MATTHSPRDGEPSAEDAYSHDSGTDRWCTTNDGSPVPAGIDWSCDVPKAVFEGV